MIEFEWDPAKAASNQKKHGVSFEEAQSVFYDEFAVQFFDEENSGAEDRFLMLGISDRARLLIVSMGTLFASSLQEKPQRARVYFIQE